MYFDERENFINYNSSNENIVNEEYNKSNYNDMNFDNLIVNNYRAASLMTLQKGFNKGNMFNDLYMPYKNYDFVIKVNNAQDEMLLRIQELTFAINDLNLYLDLHPSDTEMLKIFNEYVNKLTRLKTEYNKVYMPLCADGNTSSNEFNYIKGPWPWNEGGTNV